MCGYQIIEIPSAHDGRIDLDALRSAVGDDTAAMMITNPSTLGVFEPEIAEATEIVHNAGGQMYYDGANFNAILGKTDPGEWVSMPCTTIYTKPSVSHMEEVVPEVGPSESKSTFPNSFQPQ